jgi:hypothetical protein
VGETRVDLLHLLEDLRDAYPGSLEETIVSEIVANSLDSHAATVVFTADPGERTLCVVDDGSRMTRSELRRYHDLAASGKTRGSGIGFAGVGIKLGLLACEEVLTETRRGKAQVATTWRLASRHRAPWSWLPPLGLVPERGTAVRLMLTNGLSPLLDLGSPRNATKMWCMAAGGGLPTAQPQAAPALQEPPLVARGTAAPLLSPAGACLPIAGDWGIGSLRSGI